MKRLLYIFVALTLLMSSCNPNKKGQEQIYLPESVGQLNSLAVVIDNELWEGSVGDTIRKYFAAPVDGLPTEEPTFSLHQVPPQVFEGNTRNSRNILLIRKEEPCKAYIKDNAFARPQVVGIIQGKTHREIACKVEEYAEQFIYAFKNNDLAEAQKRFTSSLNNDPQVEQALGFSFTMPSVYKVVKKENNFFWIERPIKGGTANIILYEMPAQPFITPDDKAQSIVKMRDSIGKRYIPGPKEGMYMVTETYLAPSIFETQLKGHRTIESKGLWEVKDFPLGGPYVNYMIEDKNNKRWVVAEGFVSAPMVPKRDFLFELEAIIKSIKFTTKK